MLHFLPLAAHGASITVTLTVAWSSRIERVLGTPKVLTRTTEWVENGV